jgi:endonuclease YncB( thermonuclease family)
MHQLATPTPRAKFCDYCWSYGLLAEIVAAGLAFTCTPTKVWDGDGPIWCAEGSKVRLAGIAAREMDGTCRPGHPCPGVGGAAARDHLVALIGRNTGVAATGHVLVRGEPLRCRSEESGKGNRTAAWCSNGKSGDLSKAMVRSGHALRWARYWK